MEYEIKEIDGLPVTGIPVGPRSEIRAIAFEILRSIIEMWGGGPQTKLNIEWDQQTPLFKLIFSKVY